MIINFKKISLIKNLEEIKNDKKYSKIKFGNYLFWFDYIKTLMFMVYAVFATVSTIHLYDLFNIGNHYLLTWSLCLAAEIASVLVFIFWMERTESKIDFTFIFLVTIQLFGNIFSIYANIKTEDFGIFAEFIGMQNWELSNQKRLYSIITGAPIPIIVIGLLFKIERKNIKNISEKIEKIHEQKNIITTELQNIQPIKEKVYEEVKTTPEIIKSEPEIKTEIEVEKINPENKVQSESEKTITQPESEPLSNIKIKEEVSESTNGNHKKINITLNNKSSQKAKNVFDRLLDHDPVKQKNKS